MVETLFLTGGSGLLALNWAMAVRDQRRVVLGIHERQMSLAGTEQVRIPLESVDEIVRSLEEIQPSAVVHTAALTSVEQCEANPDLARHINVVLAANVASACARVGVPLVHISTDHLFSGDVPLVDETRPVAPLNVYGRSKAEGELRVLDAGPDTLVVRTNFFGWGPAHRSSFSDAILSSLRGGRSVALFEDVFYTPILIESLVRAVHEILDLGASGIIHVTGDDRISKYDFGVMLAAEFELDARLIEPTRFTGQKALVQRPLDMSLSNARARALVGHPLGTSAEHVARLRAQEQLGQALELRSPLS